MNDPRVLNDVLMDLAVVRGNLQHAWRSVDELHQHARGAERALEDVETETSRARFAPEEGQGIAYLRSAGDQLSVLRQRCSLSMNTAEDIEQLLAIAKHHTERARARLEHYQPDPNSPSDVENLATLRAKTEDLVVLVDLATPLAHSARAHLTSAAATAASLSNSALAEPDHQYLALKMDRGTLDASRSVAHADEAVRGLDRTLGHADASTRNLLGRIDTLAIDARARLRAGQQNPPTAGNPAHSTGPRR